MQSLNVVAPAFVEMAHRIVWATVATVDVDDRPRSRVLHPYWRWDGSALTGWIATSPTRAKRAQLERSAYASVGYWSPEQDTCTADCRVSWLFDDASREWVWDLFKNAPPPVGYDPGVIPTWSGGPTSSAFAALRLEPWHLRVMPGSVLLGEGGEILLWSD